MPAPTCFSTVTERASSGCTTLCGPEMITKQMQTSVKLPASTGPSCSSASHQELFPFCNGCGNVHPLASTQQNTKGLGERALSIAPTDVLPSTLGWTSSNQAYLLKLNLRKTCSRPGATSTPGTSARPHLQAQRAALRLEGTSPGHPVPYRLTASTRAVSVFMARALQGRLLHSNTANCSLTFGWNVLTASYLVCGHR